ncbi:RHS repeat domain-containing protein [Pseudomonas sp. O230]|uniref:RHS repeat domain-containing protein n=1 Tax=Pseudomonas sp. O230 TaxID=3159450 RepID=UPI00387AFD4D
MLSRLSAIHRNTPKLAVAEPRGLAVRSVDYYRAAVDEPCERWINHTVYDPAGRAVAQRDPRLFQEAMAPANLSTIHSLSGTALCTVSVDAGLRLSLFGQAGQPVHTWDGRGSQRWMLYDHQRRLTALFEHAANGEAVCAERLTYAANAPAFADHNQCGRLIRHDEPAGTLLFSTFGLSGGLLEQTRHFLRSLASPDWPEPVSERDTALEPGPGATTRSHFNPLGEAVEQTDAQGNRQFFSHTVAGQLREVRLQLQNDTAPKTLVSAIQYNAHGQTAREVAGNSVITTLEYAEEDARLSRLHARRGNDVLQDSRYGYDPKGNVLRIEDAAVPVRYFANQRIDPVNLYAYDSLDQLNCAKGWEAGGANKGPQFSSFDDPAPRGNYRQTYRYDLGGNLLELTHEGPQNHAHRLVAAPSSNCCLPVVEGVEPGEEDFRRGFDANGNLLKLKPGQTLSWDLRNQLCEVRPVERDGAPNDSERYVYGADGMRVRKVRSTQTNARTVIAEVRYLPNLELRTRSGTGEVLHVITVQAGRSSVQVLHWETAPPKGSANDQYRFCLGDHLGSCTLELDNDGDAISQERYHPFGTTAWFAGRGEVEASRKTIRYSGKERDATGLYCYGFRYYVAWLQRWLNPDPAGDIDGLNFYAMLMSNPVNHTDRFGLSGGDADSPAGNTSRYGPSSEKWRIAISNLRSTLFSETRPTALVHPMLGSKRDVRTATEVLSDPSRITDRSHQFRGVKYFSAEERKSYVVSVRNKRLHTADGLLLTSSAEGTLRGRTITRETRSTTSAANWKTTQMAYVLGWNPDSPNEKQLLIFQHKVNEFHHSSGFSGGRVLDAGMMTIYKGKIAFIENKSGHYKPHMEQKMHTLKFLKQSGVDLSSTFVSERIPMGHAVPGDPKSPLVADFEYSDVYRADDFYKKRGEGEVSRAPDFDPDDPKHFQYQTQVYWPGV